MPGSRVSAPGGLAGAAPLIIPGVLLAEGCLKGAELGAGTEASCWYRTVSYL
jgi:hypothetical protein